MRKLPIYYEDIKIGSKVYLGPISVKKPDIISFAKCFDPQYFHLDEEKAKTSILKGLCASGWHTCALFMRMLYDGFLKNAKSQGSPGVDYIRWIQPVRPNDVLNAIGIVREKIPSKNKPNIGIIKTQYEVFNQTNQIVMTLIAVGIFEKKNKL